MGAEIIKKTKKKDWFDVTTSKGGFLQDGLQMTAIAPVFVINHYSINVLHLFWNTM